MSDAVGEKFGVEVERGIRGVVQGDGAAVKEVGGGCERGGKRAVGRAKGQGIRAKGIGGFQQGGVFGDEERGVLENEDFGKGRERDKGEDVCECVLGGMDAAGELKPAELVAGDAVEGVEGPVGGDVEFGVAGEGAETMKGREVRDFPMTLAKVELAADEGVERGFVGEAGDEGKGEAEGKG